MIVAYHGTVEENVTSIQHYGFRKGTYFAFQVEDALEFGGPYVFTVGFSSDPLKWHGVSDGWQFWIREPLPPSTIRRMEHVQPERETDT